MLIPIDNLMVNSNSVVPARFASIHLSIGIALCITRPGFFIANNLLHEEDRRFKAGRRSIFTKGRKDGYSKRHSMFRCLNSFTRYIRIGCTRCVAKFVKASMPELERLIFMDDRNYTIVDKECQEKNNKKD